MWGEGLCSTESLRDPGFSDTADPIISYDLDFSHWFLLFPLADKEKLKELGAKFGSDIHQSHPHSIVTWTIFP